MLCSRLEKKSRHMSKVFTSIAEVASAQSAEKDFCLIAIQGIVYDANSFLGDHPGGADAITDLKGQDATEAFDAVGHTDSARKMLEDMKVGSVASTTQRKAVKPKAAASALTDEERQRILKEGRAEMDRWTFKHDILPIIVAGLVGVSTYLVAARLRRK